MNTISVDSVVFDSVLGDVVGRDRSPAAFIIYLWLWSRSAGSRTRSAKASHQAIADATHLSKSAVQGAITLLNRRKLLRSEHGSRTAVPEHFVLRPWAKR